MLTENETPNPERERTDESLRVERAKTDSELAERLVAIGDAADTATEKARTRADQAVAAARLRIDRVVPPVDAQSSKVIAKERARQDATIEAERAAADEALRVERAEHAILQTIERDETDQDLSRERARSDASLSARDAFLGIVSHDLRNMLNGMIGFAGLLAESVSQDGYDPAVVEYAQRIQRTGHRMNRLLGDLVDIASIEAGRLAVSPEVADMGAVVLEAVALFQAHALASGVSLAAQIASPMPPALFDPARILQVLTNLLSNALKFTRRDGSILVRAESLEGELRVSVIDTGTGIASDKLEVVFEQFTQLTEGDRRGVGLGLFISRSIVRGHGGRIWVESTLGEGSNFSFTVPLAAAT